MNVVITTDLEGVSGIVEWDTPDLGPIARARIEALMTGEVNAAIEGAFDAGADQVRVAEGHRAIDILQLDGRATIVPAHAPAVAAAQGWDDGFDALIQIGKHAMSDTPDGVLCHTYNPVAVEYMEINGARIGEIGVEAAEAGDFGFPTVMVSGDAAACREAQTLLGDVEVAAVKIGYGGHHANCLSPKAARDLIRGKVRTALERLGDFKPCVIPGPIRLVQRLKVPHHPEWLDNVRGKPYVEICDELTAVFTGRNVVETIARRGGLDCTWPAAT